MPATVARHYRPSIRPLQPPVNRAPVGAIGGIAELRLRYDAYLVDAWGVLHDGRRCYPGALDCLARLARLGMPVIVLSNAARRVAALAAELAALGIGAHLYRQIQSSGELCWRALDARAPAFTRNATGAFYLGPARSRGLCAGLDYDWREDVERCDFVLNTGAPDGNPADARVVDPLLRRLLRRDLPMVCANPDRVAIRAGVAGISAGAIAHRYRQLGAREVIYYGKPQGEIYRRALASLPGIDRRRVLAVGDGLETDIAGAAARGIDSLLITGGIHGEELRAAGGDLEGLTAAYRARPTWACERLRWERAT